VRLTLVLKPFAFPFQSLEDTEEEPQPRKKGPPEKSLLTVLLGHQQREQERRDQERQQYQQRGEGGLAVLSPGDLADDVASVAGNL